jgi:hypothetical protein
LLGLGRSMKVKNKIEYGTIDILDQLKEEPKIRTTMFLDIDLKKLLKDEAYERGMKYQQLVREILSKHFSETENLEERIKKLESIVLKED